MVEVVKRKMVGIKEAGNSAEIDMEHLTPLEFSADVPDDISYYPGATLITAGEVSGGLPPYRYQWLFNGNVIRGATDNVYSKSGATKADSGEYKLVASDSFGNVVTSRGLITVTDE